MASFIDPATKEIIMSARVVDPSWIKISEAKVKELETVSKQFIVISDNKPREMTEQEKLDYLESTKKPIEPPKFKTELQIQTEMWVGADAKTIAMWNKALPVIEYQLFMSSIRALDYAEARKVMVCLVDQKIITQEECDRVNDILPENRVLSPAVKEQLDFSSQEIKAK